MPNHSVTSTPVPSKTTRQNHQSSLAAISKIRPIRERKWTSRQNPHASWGNPTSCCPADLLNSLSADIRSEWRGFREEIPGSYGLDASHKGGEDDHDASDAAADAWWGLKVLSHSCGPPGSFPSVILTWIERQKRQDVTSKGGITDRICKQILYQAGPCTFPYQLTLLSHSLAI